MNRWLVLFLLLTWFVVGDLIGGVVANRYGLPPLGELAVELVLFAVVAAFAFWRLLR